jgi:hypothetical protein
MHKNMMLFGLCAFAATAQAQYVAPLGPGSWSTQTSSTRSLNGSYNAGAGVFYIPSLTANPLLAAGTMHYRWQANIVPDPGGPQGPDYFPSIVYLKSDGTASVHEATELDTPPIQYGSAENSCFVRSASLDPGKNTLWWIVDQTSTANYFTDVSGTAYHISARSPSFVAAGISPSSIIPNTGAAAYSPTQIAGLSSTSALTLGSSVDTTGITQTVLERVTIGSSPTVFATFTYQSAGGVKNSTSPMRMALWPASAPAHVDVLLSSTDPSTGSPVGPEPVAILVQYNLASGAMEGNPLYFYGDSAFGNAPHTLGMQFNNLAVKDNGDIVVAGQAVTTWYTDHSAAYIPSWTGEIATFSQVGGVPSNTGLGHFQYTGDGPSPQYAPTYAHCGQTLLDVAWSTDGNYYYVAGTEANIQTSAGTGDWRYVVCRNAPSGGLGSGGYISGLAMTANSEPPASGASGVALQVIQDPAVSGITNSNALMAFRDGPASFALYYLQPAAMLQETRLIAATNGLAGLEFNGMTADVHFVGSTMTRCIYLVGHGTWPNGTSNVTWGLASTWLSSPSH